MAIVGSSVVVGKLVVTTVPVFLIGGLRFALASLVLLPWVLLTERGLPSLSRQELGVLALQAFTGIFLFNTLLLYALTLTSAAESGILTSTTPAVTAALAVLLLRERWTRARAWGVALSVLGLLALNVMAPTGDRGPSPMVGNLLVLGAVVCEGLFVVCSRVLAQRLRPPVVASGISVLGLLMFAPFALYDAYRVGLAPLGPGEWMAIAYYGLIVTLLAFVLWARGVARVPASTAAVFTGSVRLVVPHDESPTRVPPTAPRTVLLRALRRAWRECPVSASRAGLGGAAGGPRDRVCASPVHQVPQGANRGPRQGGPAELTFTAWYHEFP